MSKEWHALRQFSEDTDITYDSCAVVPDPLNAMESVRYRTL
ncbi:MAG: hypothetical protein F4Y47_15860 [Acidobacteriia bacterium]|nr:hypothetical protein [Terriglobia bacterium]MYG03803.1 hypothetical protein [Terriglobia bacterium]MYK12047.1 hypothetical protein [Terriglobia bacterium]